MPYREKNGRWRAVVTFQGKRHTAKFETKRDAKDWESDKREELESRVTGEDMALLTFCNRYLDYADRYTVKVYKEKKALSKMIIDEWGEDTPINEITPELVQAYLDKQSKIRSANASNKDRKNLLALWNWGQDILEIKNNPVTRIKKRPHDRKPQYTPPTPDILRVLAAATKKERVFLDCYLNTGARRSEILRWTWNDDVNFQKRQVRLGTRKTRDGSMEYVWLPMTDDLYESLWWLWNNRKFKKTPYVFVREYSGYRSGQPIKTRQHFMRRLCKRAGVKQFGFHALRRYVASVLADTHKVSAKSIQRILRHKNLATTERYIQNVNNDLKNTLSLISFPQNTPEHTPKTKKARE